MKPREPRRKVLIQARIRIDGAWGDVCIRNISSRGLLAQAAAPPPRGSYVEIFRAKHIIIGRVVWRKDRRFGIHTQDRLDISAIVEEPALAGGERGTAPAAGLSVERRSDPHRLTAAGVAQRRERSQRISAIFQFACIVACGAMAAAITAGAVLENLSRPLAIVASHLRPVK